MSEVSRPETCGTSDACQPKHSQLSYDLQINATTEHDAPTSQPLDYVTSSGSDSTIMTSINLSVNASIQTTNITTSITSCISNPGLTSVAPLNQSDSIEHCLQPTSSTVSSENNSREHNTSPKFVESRVGQNGSPAGLLDVAVMREPGVMRDGGVVQGAHVQHDMPVMHDTTPMHDNMQDHPVMRNATSQSPLDGNVSIDSPPAPSPSLEDIGSSRLDRRTPDMSLSSSISTNLNSSVSSSPMTPLNQECSGIPSPDVPPPVSSTSFLHDDSGIDDNSHSSAPKCTLMESSCHEETVSTRSPEESLHIPYR